jgi:hypothetical protein
MQRSSSTQRSDVGGGEPLGAQPQGGVHARVGEVVARVRLEDHARQLPVRAQAADDGVRVGAVAAERLQEPEAALQHGRRAGEPVPGQGSVIRSTMADVEQIVRFEAPKYLACYVDVLRYHLGDSVPEGFAQLPDIGMLLELGVSRETELSMMTLGMSRTSAIALSEYIINDNLIPEDCRTWISEHDLAGLDIPALVRKEIEKYRRMDAAAS